MALMPCEVITPPECEPVVVDCPVFTLFVCGNEYEGNTKEEAVYAAWLGSGIRPNWLRFMAITPSYLDVYWL